MDRKYWAFVIPGLEPDPAETVRKLEDRGIAGVAVPQVYGAPFAPLAAVAALPRAPSGLDRGATPAHV